MRENYLPLFLRHPNAITREIEDGLEVSLEGGLIQFHLNGTAQRVWELAIRPISLDEIVENITNTYGRPSSIAREEVLQFLDDAARYTLISHFISRAEAAAQSVE